MNIIVKPYGSTLCYCRPDTTWERENRDFYSPECVNEIYWTPVVFARISKAGKCVSGKFVERYYDGFNFGVLMYCTIEDSVSAFVDHTSILPHPLYNPVVLEGENDFEILRNGEKVDFSNDAKDISEDMGINIPRADGYTAEIEYFLECVKNDTPPTKVTPESSEGSVRLVERILKNVIKI